MEYKCSTELSKSHCESVIKHSVDFYSITLDGGELVGWINKRLFSISVTRGMLKSDLVRNKVLGRISTKNNKTYVYFRTYRGYTDIVSIITMFIVCFISASLADISTGVLSFLWKIIISALFCLLIAAISWMISHASEDGQENENLLVEFLQKGLELRNENNSNQKS
ncbi:hypothetical protein [Paenibacillus sp. XY044]|uniref:hypothetical protein n=1 Tax=Paenibacillus sp. XY044 TaxID=2026089 RepID=UPI0015C67474|nr:hypothetical protein [Paenibacillus sp. XY044]